jgi:dTMP kinase
LVTGQAGSGGRLVALEGIDGSGKSTQARILAERLGAQLTFEPGDTVLGAAIRVLLLDPVHNPSARAEALLMAADRAQHVHEVISPALASGRWVVTDRYCGSTLAYQGFGRRLGLSTLMGVLAFATDGVVPHLSVLLDVPLELARARRHRSAPDRLERHGEDFHARVVAGYRELVRSDPDHWVAVDGTGDVATVAEAVHSAVVWRLGRPG